MIKKTIIFIILPLYLFFRQLYQVLHGINDYDRYQNPKYILLISLFIPLIFLYGTLMGGNKQEQTKNTLSVNIFSPLLGFSTIAFLFKDIRRAFTLYSDPSKHSDVIPQLETLYNRFIHGEFPYKGVPMPGWEPYPVYMPLHWLPIAIPKLLHVDVRWSGMLLMAIAAGLYVYHTYKENQNHLTLFTASILPAIVLWNFLTTDFIDIPVSLETIIAAYYLVLAIGLMTRNLVITTVGIILCLLSRYTMIFWLPMFFIFLWFNNSGKQNISVWLSIILSFLILYIIPFYLHDTTIFSKGINYHNLAVLNEWKGHPYSFEPGIYFGQHMYDAFHGTIEQKVFMAREVQAACMLGLMGIGLLLYRILKSKMSYYDLSLAMLYYFLLFFYLFGPLTYRYYYLPFFMVSAVIVGRTLMFADNSQNNK